MSGRLEQGAGTGLGPDTARGARGGRRESEANGRSPSSTSVEVPRRDFLGLAGMWTSGIAIFGSLAGMARLAKPRVSPDASSVFRLGRAEDFPPGSVQDLPAQGVRVMSTEAGIAVLSLVCTHLGCMVKQGEEGFGCPCHGSSFDPKGKVIAGPAPRPLRWLAISQTPDGTLLADKAKEVPPGHFLKALGGERGFPA